MADAWARVGADHLVARDVGAALAVSARLGSPARAAVRSALDAARDRAARRGAVDGAVAGARATGRLLSVLPLAGPLAVLGLGLDPVATYALPAAALSTAAGVGLTVCGHRWVGRQVRRALAEEPAS